MELGKWLKHAYAISIVVLLHIIASLSLGHHHANATRCVERERDALLAIKRDLVDNRNLLSSWDSGSEAQKQDCCRWERVYCNNQTGHVLRLDLGNDNPWPNPAYSGPYFSPAFEGKISPQLTQLHDLTYLNLSYNYFNWNQIPAFIGSLTNLRHLDLNLACFGGQILSHAFGNLTHLTYLDLSHNDFIRSQIPAFIGSLTSLRYLDLSWASFGGQITSHALGNLTHLTYLDLSYNYFNESKIPAFIGSLTNLRYLDLSQAEFGGQIPSHALGNLTHLTYLDLKYNSFLGSQIPAFIGSLTSLRYLDLSQTGFGGQIPSHALGNLTHLQYLNLGVEYSITSLSVENLNWLPHLSSLKYLDLSGTNLGNVFDWLEIVNKLPNLRNLSLSGCGLPRPIISSSFSHINSSKSLASVDLQDASAITSSIFKWLCNYNTTLVHLDLSYTQLIDLNPDVFRNMRSLEYLDLSFTQLSDLNPDVFRNMRSLEYLDLSKNQLSDLIPDVFTNMSSLEHLDLSYNQLTGLIPDGFRNICSLEYLDLHDNQLSGLTPYVFTNMSSLAHLDLSNNLLEGEIPKSISQLCSLQSLKISGCSLDGLFSEFVQRWSSTCPQISLLSLDLSSNHLAGSFPNLTNFSSLKELSLSANQLSGMVPERIGKLSSLEKLDLSQNGLSGMIPESIGQLSSLQELHLSGNRLSGRIPESIGNLSSLLEFYLSENNLSGMIPESIGQLGLGKLDLRENQLSGIIPESIGQLSLLSTLDLSRNRLSGRIPRSIGQLSNLWIMNFSMNSLKGVISETHFSNLSSLLELDLSSNSLVFNVISDWVPPFQLNSLNLRSCYVGMHFPTWLRTQIECLSIDISYAGISDVLPSWFWDLFAKIQSIDLSHNQIRGTFGSSEMVSFRGLVLDVRLSSNQFEGPIPSFLSNAQYLDLSNNTFSEMTSFLCAPNIKRIQFLDLSINNFSGELPNCWRHFDNLVLLDLSNNYFSGEIPTTIGSLFRIETLKLRSNRLVGELPSALKNCTSLKFIDVGHNKLSRSVPEWLGVSLPNLVILMLQSNQFSGSLPSQLCQLTRLQILDISMNEISGTIPKCLKNLTSLAQEGNSSQTLSHFFDSSVAQAPTYPGDTIPSDHYDDEATFMWKARMSEYKSILGLVKSIDLSSNRLTGEIPSEITHLAGLVSLNLSRNYLTGQIPPEIGNLKSLDSLDLHINQIDGRIPTSLAQINRLGYLDLSYNKLSGEIPIGTQLQGRDPSFYAGNSQLCGPPLKKICPEGTGQPNVSSNQEDPDKLIKQGFYISLGLGFAVGFWGVCGSLIFKRSWRYAYYKFLNASNDWLYVKVALIRRKLKDRCA